MKKIICNILIVFLLTVGFCDGYFSICQLSSGRIWLSDSEVYAADGWESVTQDDLVTAFRYYCKSRNLTIDGSLADALTSFTTTTFNNICNTLGIDVTSLQADLKKTVDGNLGLRFLMNQQGVLAYNRIFAEFLQNNDLVVGDSVDNEVIYSGDSIDGHFIYVINAADRSNVNPIIKYGTDFYNGLDIYRNAPQTITFYGTTRTTRVTSYDGTGYKGTIAEYGEIVYRVGVENQGGVCLARIISDNNKIYPCAYNIWKSNVSWRDNPVGTKLYQFYKIGSELPSGSVEPADITVDTPGDTTINNNTYNYNYTIIYNDGDHYGTDDEDEPLPTTPPGGGGGGGDDPSDPLDPYDPNKPFPDTPDNPTPSPGITDQPGSDGTITIPDFNFDLPDINWSLDGLQHKFPFSLPFDLYNACKLLDAEPETPELNYTIDLVVYQWPVNYDLQWLDPAARVIRIFELLAFVVGLILVTRKLIGN